MSGYKRPPSPVTALLASKQFRVMALVLLLGGLCGILYYTLLYDPRTEWEKTMAERIDTIDTSITEIYEDGLTLDETIRICTELDTWADWVNGVLGYQNQKDTETLRRFGGQPSAALLQPVQEENKHMRSTYTKAHSHKEFLDTAKGVCA